MTVNMHVLVYDFLGNFGTIFFFFGGEGGRVKPVKNLNLDFFRKKEKW